MIHQEINIKNSLLIFVMVLGALTLNAQEKDKVFPISIGYFGAYVIEAGIKVGTAARLKSWELKKGGNIRSRSLWIRPQIGIFTRPTNHTSFVLNTDIAYKSMKSQHRYYVASAMGLGYLMANQILSTTIDLNSGDVIGKEREVRHYFLPTITFDWGKEPNKSVGWYTRISYGRKISANIEDSAFLGLELGITYLLRKSSGH